MGKMESSEIRKKIKVPPSISRTTPYPYTPYPQGIRALAAALRSGALVIKKRLAVHGNHAVTPEVE